MTANINNADNAHNYDNLKNIKTFSIPNSRALAEEIDKAKKRLREIEKSIEEKRNRFLAEKQEAELLAAKKNEENEETQSEKPAKIDNAVEQGIVQSAPVVKEEHRIEVKKVEKTKVEVPATEEKPKELRPPVAPAPKTVEPKIVEAPKPEVKAPAVKVIESTGHESREISSVVNPDGTIEKTFIDEKGNIKVRRFIERPYSKDAPRNPSPQGSKPPYQKGVGDRPQGNRPPYQQRNTSGSPRPQGNRPPYQQDKDKDATQRSPRPPIKKTSDMPVVAPKPAPNKTYGNKNKTHDKSVDDKRTPNKKTLITRTFTGYDDDDGRVIRSRSRGKKQPEQKPTVMVIDHAVITTQEVSIKVLSEKIGKTVSEIIKKLFEEDIMKQINDSIDFTVAEYVAGSLGVKLELKLDKTAEETMLSDELTDNLPDDTKRPPIVTVMGHVDHGKTLLLDAIRKTHVAEGEAGGITQHIGAYTVTINGEQITFIDTPGHAAFTKMRERGAQVTDVAIIVVAANDGVMPQTIEAISHAKAAEVPIIVAINKIDLDAANPEAVKSQLTEYGLLAEEWGGDTIMVPVSARENIGINKLLEAVLTVAEVRDLKANPKKRAIGTVIEAKVDKKRGLTATVLVSNGTLRIGDSLLAGTVTGKVRAMFNDRGQSIKEAGPSFPAEVLGFSELPKAGDYVYTGDDRLIRKVLEERKDKEKEAFNKSGSGSITLGGLFGKISEGELKNLNLILKTDVQGSLEAFLPSFKQLSTDEIKVNPIHSGVGTINETDVSLAKASNAIIIGFNVDVDSVARVNAERNKIEIKQYSIIYDALDEVGRAMKGLLGPQYKEVIIGKATVRKVFNLSSFGKIAGCYVNSGKVTRNSRVRVFRGTNVVFNGPISSLKREKDDVKEVAANFECGISLVGYGDFLEEDVFEVYQLEEIKND